MKDSWRQSTWGGEITLEYGKALRGYDSAAGKYQVFGSNGPVGWTDQPLAPGPGVILGRKGAYRGVRYSAHPFFVIDTAYYVVPKTDLDMRWLYYAIKYYKLGEIDDGSPIPSTTRAAVYMRDLAVPPPVTQRATSLILGTIDDKIELNRRTSQTLEALAQVLFKSWFVDFDPVRLKAEGRLPGGMDAATAKLFPSKFEGSGLGDIPKGWSVTTLKELTSKIGSGATPRGGDRGYVDEGVSFIRSQNVYDSEFVWDGLARITDADADQLRGVTVQPEDVLLNITGASILRTCVVERAVIPARVNQHVAIVRARDGIPARYLHLHLLRESTKAYLMGFDAGASRQAVTKGHIESVPVLLPSDSVLARFHELTEPIYMAVDNCRTQGRSLAFLRDALLPRLLSGEVRLKHPDRFIGGA